MLPVQTGSLGTLRSTIFHLLVVREMGNQMATATALCPAMGNQTEAQCAFPPPQSPFINLVGASGEPFLLSQVTPPAIPAAPGDYTWFGPQGAEDHTLASLRDVDPFH